MRWLIPLILFILLAVVGWLFLTPSSAPGTIPPGTEAEEAAPHATMTGQPLPTAQDQTSENVPAPSRTKMERPALAKADEGPWVTAQLLSPEGSPAKGAFAWLARNKQEQLMRSPSRTIRSGKLDYPTFKADELGMVRVPHNQGKPNWLKVGGEHWVRVEMDVSDWKKDQDLDLGTITLFPAFSIHGTLTDFDQNPLGQQTIFLEGDATNSPFNRAPPLDLSISDDEGGFQFFGLTPGEYKVKATPQGWVAKTQNVEILDQDLNLYLEVLPGLTMQGQVVDHEGNPIPSARVRLDDQSLFYGFQPFSIKENEGVGVDQNGYFTCSGMPETGKKTLQVSAPGFLCSKPQFVSAGTFLKVNLRPACQLAGRIVDWNQQPVVKARVACTTQEDFGDTLTRGSQTDGEGKFLFEKLALGKAKLAITSQFGALTLELSIEKNGEFLEIELPKVAGWKLLVIDPGGTPIPKAYIRIEESIPEPENRTFDRFSLGNSLWENPGTSAGTTDGNGKWMVYGLQDVTLLLTVSKRGWVKSVQKLRPPSAEKDFTVVLEKAAILNVTLLKADGSPADDISLGFFSEAQSELAGLMVEHTDKNGKATFDQLNGGPGELRLYGMQREAHENERWPIQLVAGESSSITCHLPTECTLRVLVLDNGNPVPRAKINLHPLHEDESDDLFRELRLAGLPGKGHTGPDGVAFISGLDAIEYEIVAQPPLASPPHRQRVFVTEGENLLTLELSQGRLEGRIRDSFGPVQNGRVSLHPIKTEEEDASKGDFHTISFSMNGEMYEWAPSGAYQKTNLDGVFSFRHLSKGLWKIRIKAAGHLDWISEPISLPAHGFHDMGSIFLEASGSLKGQILNLPAETTFTSMASLSLQPTKEGEYAYLHSTSDTAGNYSFSTVPAGEYTLTISFQVEVESLRKFETEPIQILQGQETVFDWKMPN